MREHFQPQDEQVIQVVDARLTRMTDAICSSLQISQDAVSVEGNESYSHKLKLKIKITAVLQLEGGSSLRNFRQELEKTLGTLGVSITQGTFTSEEYLFDLFEN